MKPYLLLLKKLFRGRRRLLISCADACLSARPNNHEPREKQHSAHANKAKKLNDTCKPSHAGRQKKIRNGNQVYSPTFEFCVVLQLLFLAGVQCTSLLAFCQQQGKKKRMHFFAPRI
jgi:hypothetical protein